MHSDFLMQHKFGDKSDDELRQIVLNNAVKVLAAKNVAELERFNKESDYCVSLVQSRINAREEWKQNFPERKQKAILNLKTAVTPNGQLIAAILEDEGGLTTEEICGWCEELSAMEQSEVQAILDELVSEGVLRTTDGKYYLYRICTETLLPEDPVHWAMTILGLPGKKGYWHSYQYILLRALEMHGTAVDPTDFPEILEQVKEEILCDAPPEEETRISEAIDEIDVGIIREVLEECTYGGVLDETKGIYYFTMLGEKVRK